MELSPIDKALKTWYEPDNPLYCDPEHPTLKLAGKIGELLDLYAKHKYKPNFDWTDCKHCKRPGIEHNVEAQCNPAYSPDTIYTEMVLDELGDIWYYLRILAWMNDVSFSHNRIANSKHPSLYYIKAMYSYANNALQSGFGWEPILVGTHFHLTGILFNLDYTLDQLTELNYQKLNSEPTNHGWEGAG